MRPSYRTLVLLASILLSINPLVIVEIDILFGSIGLLLRLLLLLGVLADFVLIIFVVRQLAQIVVIWVLLAGTWLSLILNLRMHPPLLLPSLILLLVQPFVHFSYSNSNVKTNIFKKLIVIN